MWNFTKVHSFGPFRRGAHIAQSWEQPHIPWAFRSLWSTTRRVYRSYTWPHYQLSTQLFAGLPFSSVDVRLINKTLLGKTQDSQISEIYYAVDYSYGPDMKPPDPSQAVQKFQGFLNGSYGTFVITNGTLPVKPSKLRVASSSTTALPVEEPVIVETSTISDHTGMKPFSYIIYDYLRLMYDSKKQHDEAMAACQTVWSAVLGTLQ